jgi:pimeloyl-ACP methyl ester carboxylesterase
MPTFLVRAFLLRSFARLTGDDSGDGERALLLAHTEEIVRTRLQRADVVALMARLIDQTENDPYTASGSLAWSGPTLLLFGSDDPVAPPDKREALRRRYPQAEVCVIDGADHTMALSHRQAYYGAIDAFLAAEKKPGVITTRSR